MRALAFLLLSSMQLQAHEADPMPDVDLDRAITCLAYTTVEMEWGGPNVARLSSEIVFFARLVAAKSSPADHEAFEVRFAEELAFYRDPKFEDGGESSPELVDEILTGTSKMCWRHVLAAEGGPYFEE